MKVTTLPLLLFVVLGLAQTPATNNKVDLGQAFKIKNGEEVLVRGEKLRITFRSVPMDSRCPSDVVCHWAGNGEIVVEVTRKNKKQVVATLNTLLDPKEDCLQGIQDQVDRAESVPKGE